MARSWSHLAADAVRWSARVVGGLVATFFLLFLIPEAIGGEWRDITVADAVALTSIVVMVVALVVGWFWEGVAGATLLAGYAVLVIAHGRLVPAPPYLLFPILGLMFAFCFWRSRKAHARQQADRRRNARRLAVLAGALLGLMAIAAGLVALMEMPGPVIAAPPEWVGEWRGEFDVPYSEGWTAGVQPMTLIIRPDGGVEGTLGDAALVNGQLRRTNRILIWLGHQRRVINAGLEGFVVKKERIAAESVTLRPHFEAGHLQLSFEAYGEEFGYITSNEFPLQRV